MRPTDRTNRLILTLLGLVLLAAGIYALLRAAGSLGEAEAQEPVLSSEVRRWVNDNGGWFWPVAAAVSLLVSWLAYRWLRAHLPSSTLVREVDRSPDGDEGKTIVRTAGLADAVAADIEAYPGVTSASARLLGHSDDPEVVVTVGCADDADVTDIRQRIDEHALPRLRQALEFDRLTARVAVKLSGPGSRLVV